LKITIVGFYERCNVITIFNIISEALYSRFEFMKMQPTINRIRFALGGQSANPLCRPIELK